MFIPHLVDSEAWVSAMIAGAVIAVAIFGGDFSENVKIEQRS